MCLPGGSEKSKHVRLGSYFNLEPVIEKVGLARSDLFEAPSKVLVFKLSVMVFLLGVYLLRFLLLLSKCHNGYCVLCLEVAKQFFRVQLVGEVCEFYSTQLF